jgi:NAD(P)-dependent dehydrogenase (short-subunit alcohol dehydrogenase family)
VLVSKRWQTYNLRGKTVLITGGSRGLGFALAREFARHGAHVVICARDRTTLARAREKLAEQAVPVLAVPCDVTQPPEIENLLRTIHTRTGRVDVVVNLAPAPPTAGASREAPSAMP